MLKQIHAISTVFNRQNHETDSRPTMTGPIRPFLGAKSTSIPLFRTIPQTQTIITRKCPDI